MYLRTIQPIRDKDAYSQQLEKLVTYDLFQLIFKPLIDLLDNNGKENARPSVLVNAFLTRKIYYNNGFVFGTFNASISRALTELGGKFNKTRKAFKIELSQFPPEIRNALARASAAEQEATDNMRKKLQELSLTDIVIPATEKIATSNLVDLHKQFEKVTPRDLEIPIEMNDAQRKKMTEDYNDNVNLEINDLANDAVQALRQRVEIEVGMGTRADKLKDILFAQYGVVSNRAKFIARQETSLFVAKYRQVRYEDAGLNEYQWSTSHDENVRTDHKELNGLIFSWDNPPITNRKTGARNNPGEDFGCRCVALPVIRTAGSDRNILETTEHRALHTGGR